MKRIFLYLAITLSAPLAGATSLDVKTGNVIYRYAANNVGVVDFSGGESLTIRATTYKIEDIGSIKVVEEDIDDNTVEVVYSGPIATVIVAGNLAEYIDAEISGANVIINQSTEVSDNTCGEITYILSGESSDGSFTQIGSYKSTIELNGLTLTSLSGAAIDIQNSKRVKLSSKINTVNTLADATSGSQKAAVYCKGHLEMQGKGTLNVTGNTAHAISAKEYIEFKNCSVNILGSVKDGINCNQYFTMTSGNLVISNPGDDGIQVSYKDDVDRETEDTGTFTLEDGSITIDKITAASAKGIKTDNDVIIKGGRITASTSAPGSWDSSKLKTKASACIGADGNVEISGGSLNLSASGGGGKGITCDGNFIYDQGTLTITTSGGVLAYVNNSLNQNYTGNTDRLNSDYKSSPKGIKADGDVKISGGEISIVTSGNGGEGIESKAVVTIDGGNIKVRAKDDAINSSSTMYINDGIIDVISTGNDGLDSNGDMWIAGGLVMAFGGSSPECGIDVNEEERYQLYFTGGYILGAGGGNSTPSDSSKSTQAFVTPSVSLSAGSQVTISGGSVDYTFNLPSDLTSVNLGGSGQPGRPGGMGSGNSSSLLISVPGLVSGSSYTVKSGSTTVSATAKTADSSSGGRPGGR
ncbi:MAG: carbohydrate-binding domain-containing protein [Muribaculaceae bacterium]|nr:carbohydrate-binding domain-containing protein [Muribaculaceae bacterium]